MVIPRRHEGALPTKPKGVYTVVVAEITQLNQEPVPDLQAVFAEFLQRVLQSPSVVEINIAAALALEALSLLQ